MSTSTGWNPQHGHDHAGRTSTADPGISMAYPYLSNFYAPQAGPGGYPYPYLPYSMPIPLPMHGSLAQFPIQPNGAGNPYARMPGPAPIIDPEMPAANLCNTSGGSGCEPGFNYFFPPEHAKIFVLRCGTPPWQVTDQSQIGFTASHVPTNVTVGQLMRGFGCDHPIPKKNKVVEVVPGGQGKWYKGLTVSGDEKDKVKQDLASMGWAGSRGDGKPGVFLWFSKG